MTAAVRNDTDLTANIISERRMVKKYEFFAGQAFEGLRRHTRHHECMLFVIPTMKSLDK